VIVLCGAWLVLGIALIVTSYTTPGGRDGGGASSALGGLWVAGYLPVVAVLHGFQVVLVACLAAMLYPSPVD
jgi:hypothetical protein